MNGRVAAFNQLLSQVQCMMRFSEWHPRSGASQSWHVLLLQRRPSIGGANGPPGLRHAEPYAANTTAALLAQGGWPVLLARCGDALMLHLLLHASIFAPLPNGCLLQLSGLPAVEVKLDTLTV